MYRLLPKYLDVFIHKSNFDETQSNPEQLLHYIQTSILNLLTQNVCALEECF